MSRKSKQDSKSEDQRKAKRPSETGKDAGEPQARIPALPSFSHTLGDIDLHLFGEGKHERIYEKLGAHCRIHEGKRGVSFAVWAPAADRVSVVGDFNDWNASQNPMRGLGSSGVWENFIPGLRGGELYKYAITTGGQETFKADPYASM